MVDGSVVADVAVVIVNHSSGEKVTELLGDLRAACPPPREVVIVDNGAVPFVGTTCDGPFTVEVIRVENRGFGSAVNEGVRRSSAASVCISNPDVRLRTPDVFHHLHKSLADRGVAIAAPQVLGPDGHASEDVTHQLPSVRSSLSMVLKRRHHRPAPPQSGDVDNITGAFFMIDRSTWNELGGFDEAYFMYFEDADLCARVKRMGLRILVVPGVSVEHEVGGTPASWVQRRGWYEASRLRYFSIWRPRHEGLAIAWLAALARRRPGRRVVQP